MERQSSHDGMGVAKTISIPKEALGTGAIHQYTERGKWELPGASYYDNKQFEECKKLPGASTTPIGVNYCVTSMFKKDMADESFTAVLNINIRYKIHDEDLEIYEDLQKQGNIADIQEVASQSSNLKVKPPVLEVMNSESYEFKKWRVVYTQRCFDRKTEEWRWYVELSCQLQTQCEEELEVKKFPYCRQAMQIHIQPKQDTKQLLLVPYEEPDLQPKHCVDPNGEVIETRKRMNGLTCPKHLGTYEVESHHAFFPPNDYLAPMPTGSLYSKCILTIQCRQKPEYFLFNTVPIVLFLPLFSSMALLEPIENVADRLSIVLALLFTMAAYKVSISSWMPTKSYLTFLDWYILFGFGVILIIGVVVGVSGMFALSSEGSGRRMSTTSGGSPSNGSGDDDDAYSGNIIESTIVIFLMIGWVAAHIVWLVLYKSGSQHIDPSWAKVLKDENKGLRERAKEVAKLMTYQEEELKSSRANLKAPERPGDNDTKKSGNGSDEEVIKSLLSRLQDSEAAARHGVLLGLRQVAKRGDKKVIDAVAECFKDENYEVQTAAAESLGQLVCPGNHHAVVMALKSSLVDKASAQSRSTTKTLGKDGAGGSGKMRAAAEGKGAPLGLQSVQPSQISTAADLLPSLLVAMDAALASIPCPTPQAAPQAALLAEPHAAEQALRADQQPNRDHHPRPDTPPRPNRLDRSPTSAPTSSAAGHVASRGTIEGPSAAEVASSSSTRSSSKKKKKKSLSCSTSSSGRPAGQGSGQ